MMASRRPLLRLFATGGTIASQRVKDEPGYSPTVSGHALLNEVPGWESIARVEVTEFSQMTSFMFSLDDVMRLVGEVRAAVNRPDIDGVVVMIGTAAMEEVAYLLDLLVESTKPIVLTGAMINASQPGRDGPKNIRDALRFAADPSSHDLGVTVVMAGEAHAARSVQKLHRTAVTAFTSAPKGPVAYVDADRIVHLYKPTGRIHFPIDSVADPVDVIAVTLATDDRLMKAAIASGSRGIVLQGFPGGGGVTPPLMAAVREAVSQGLPVVVTSRAPIGRAVPGAGGGAGPSDLAAAGAIVAGDLSAAKARLLLMCALARSNEIEAIRAVFGNVAP